ncbi:MAG: 4Fe-4S dicluster domain-containing protein [Spirochaetes bacterium]|nr:4Fe-4S dicluster domain-containing protein [Spirochaetota bacterium]
MPANTDTKSITFTVSREQREAGRRDEFEVPCDAYTTVLDGLEYIRTRLDSTLMYRHSCHHGSCGTCGMIINGEKLLACTTNVFSLETDTVTVRPLPQFEAVGDLVVDPASLFADFPAHADYRRASEYNADARVPEEIEAYERFENCIECGLCVSACPVTSNWMGPAALAAWNRELEKNPERREEILDSVDVDRGAWSCERHLKCSAVCPTGVYPAKHIALLKRAAKARREE